LFTKSPIMIMAITMVFSGQAEEEHLRYAIACLLKQVCRGLMTQPIHVVISAGRQVTWCHHLYMQAITFMVATISLADCIHLQARLVPQSLIQVFKILKTVILRLQMPH